MNESEPHTMTPPGLARYLLSAADSAMLSREFPLQASNVALGDLSPAFLAALPAQGGCYFWVLRVGRQSYKIYLGQTSSLRRRVTDYARGFQVHWPNDYKLQFTEALMGEVVPGAQWDLYFLPVATEDFTARETELVRAFKPLVNTLPRPTPPERQQVQAAFAQYYRSVVLRHLA